MSQEQYFGGIPTEPDVNKLREQYPESSMDLGAVIPYGDVARVIGCRKDSSRFKTVTNRWRRLVERETGTIVIGTERGVGFKILDNQQKLNVSSSLLDQSVRRSRRAYQVTGRINLRQLSDEDRERLLAIQQRTAAVVATAQIQSTTDLPSLEVS